LLDLFFDRILVELKKSRSKQGLEVRVLEINNSMIARSPKPTPYLYASLQKNDFLFE
jgi:hypothetical protein